MQEILNVSKLEKSYKDNKVIKGLSFEVEKGEILCFLGPNGAGKSTTINILTGALGYDSGAIYYKGVKMDKITKQYKQQLGIVPQDICLYEDISAEKNINFFASIYGLRGKKLEEATKKALQFAGLEERANDKVKTFSGGMKRRLNIACAITHKPELLIMDEPTVGIDPQSRNHILASVKKLRASGMTIIYTTHYMEEVEEISTRIIIVDKGQIIASGTKEKLKEDIMNFKIFDIDIANYEKLNTDEFYRIEGVKKVSLKEGKLKLTTLTGIENLDKIIAVLVNNSVKINNLSSETASLETVFLNLTGKKLRD